MLRFRTPLQSFLQISHPHTWLRQRSLRARVTAGGSNNSSGSQGCRSASSQVVGPNHKHEQEGVEAKPEMTDKLAPRAPLVKNFFIGKVDRELLAYPEVVTREDMSKLQLEVLPLRNFFAEEVDLRAIDATRTLPSTLLDNMRSLGLYGINVPVDYDGKGWGWSASLLASEAEANCTDVALSLLSHRVIVDLLQEHGTLDQQQRYLSKMASGALVATEAVYEFEVPDDGYFNTTAEYQQESASWALNGKKAFVISGPLPAGSSQLFLVIAETYRLNTSRDGGRGTTIFLVDAAQPGVKVGDQHLTIGCRGVQMRHVHFNDVQVPESSVVGHPHEGNVAADALQLSGRLRYAMLGLSMGKSMLNELTEYSIQTKQFGEPLKDMEMTQAHLAKATCAVYAIESMIYYTAGLLDEFKHPDVALEAAIVKYYTLTRLFKIVSKCMEVIGPKALHAGEISELAFRNAAQLQTQGESIDTLRLVIALTGLQHAGTLLNETVRMSRNPLFHPKHMFSKFLQTSSIENPTSKMRLADNLHPSLTPAAQCIEHAVVRLQLCVNLLLTRYGNQVVERHIEMQRVAEMAANIYAMFASASRASRSYCIGLQLADYEMLAASTICSHGGDVVKTLANEIFNGSFINNDNNLQRLVKQVVKSKGAFAVNPLTYNF